VKHLRNSYFEQVIAWDKKHRLIGKTPIQQLYAESLLALRSQGASYRSRTLVDIGAGSGVLGFAHLFSSRRNLAVFVEPDIKKASFLRLFVAHSLSSRAFVISDPIESVSRETLDRFVGHSGEAARATQKTTLLFVARAFSGVKTLEKTLENSWIAKEEVCVFAADEKKKEFFFDKLKFK